MNSAERGAIPLVLGIGIAVIVGALVVGYFFTQQEPDSSNSQAVLEKTVVTGDETTQVGGELPSSGNADEGVVNDTAEITATAPTSAYQGEVLAGSSSPLLVFNQADYDQAVGQGKLVVLYFYANWCPTCKAEFPLAQAAFDQLTSDQAVGFRVNFNDNETDDSEEALARQFGVPYQHTKVFTRGGTQVLKSPETWTRQRYITEITNRL